jgi:hypothetical protein
MNIAMRRAGELGAMMMIGDGMLAAAWPKEHVRLWQSGPRLWRKILEPFASRPGMTRALGVAEMAVGAALAWATLRQQPQRSG